MSIVHKYMTTSPYEFTFNVAVTSLKGIPQIQIDTDADAALWMYQCIKEFFTDSKRNKIYELSSEDKLLVSRISLVDLPKDLETSKKIIAFVQKYVVIVPTKMMVEGAMNTSHDFKQNYYFFATGWLEDFSPEDVQKLKKYKKDHWLKLQQSEVAIISELGFKFIKMTADYIQAIKAVAQINKVNNNKIKAIKNNTIEEQPLLQQTKKTECCSCVLL